MTKKHIGDADEIRVWLDARLAQATQIMGEVRLESGAKSSAYIQVLTERNRVLKVGTHYLAGRYEPALAELVNQLAHVKDGLTEAKAAIEVLEDTDFSTVRDAANDTGAEHAAETHADYVTLEAELCRVREFLTGSIGILRSRIARQRQKSPTSKKSRS